jgi:uncharacterized RDD family membrane protein YckC
VYEAIADLEAYSLLGDYKMENNVYKAPESELTPPDESSSELAPLGRRLLASIIDSLITGVIIIPLLYFTGGFDGVSTGQEPSFLYTLVTGLIGIAVFLAINFNLLKSSGQTIGKRVMKIKIVTLDGQLPDVGNHLVKRYAVFMLPGQIPYVGQFFSLINILFIFARDRRCIHDHVAGTKVVSCE